MSHPELVRIKIDSADMAVRLAGAPDNPGLLLIHGFPGSSRSYSKVIGTLARDCFVIAPDLPGFGTSEPIDATRAPGRIRSLIVQNANAHPSGLGPQWSATRAYWDDPTAEREAEATAHLTFEVIRDQYIGGVPKDVAERIDPGLWEEDWRIMSLPGRLETQRALVLDYRSHVERFGEIADYFDRWQPPAMMLWGRHDPFFCIDETLSWLKALPRMEAHIFDGPHLLLETHAAECGALMGAFLRRAGHRGPAMHE